MPFPPECDITSQCCWNQNTRFPTAADSNSTSQMLCAAGNQKKQAPPTVVMWLSHTAAPRFLFLLNDSRCHSSTCIRHVCARERQRERQEEGEFLHASYRASHRAVTARTKKDPCNIHKEGCKEKNIRRWRLFKYSRKTFLILITMASGVNFSYFVFLCQVLTSTVVLAQLLKRSHEKTESWKASLY